MGIEVGTLADHRDLWRRIHGLAIGPAGAQLTFERRLARENGWTLAYTERVVEEYRRFLLLAAISPEPLTPSDAVDQAWHLHLAYTESYWDDLCGDVLGKPLHHGPTRGGFPEGRKFERWYERTLGLYEKVFGEAPPEEVWPPSADRFSDAVRFQRVDLGSHVLVRWPRFLRGAAAGVGLFLALTVASASAAALAGFTAPQILGALGLLLVAATLIALLRSSRSRERAGAGVGGGGAAGAACGGCGHAGCGGCGGGGCGGCGG